MVTKRQLMNQFLKTQNYCVNSIRELRELGEMETKYFGVSHGDVDADGIIDSVDYGGGGMTFKEYLKEMKEQIELSISQGSIDCKDVRFRSNKDMKGGML